MADRSVTELPAAADRYAGSGWALVPLHAAIETRCTCGDAACKSPGKHPRTQRGIKDATSDADQVREWWQRWPGASIGLACGKASGCWVLDVDAKAPKGGMPGLQALADYERVHGRLPDTLCADTGSGGLHLFFSLPEGRRIRNRARIRSIDGVRSGLDVRSTGGYVVLPPSPHASGQRYRWRNDADILEAPLWLLDLVDPPAPVAAAPAARPAADSDSRDRRYCLGALHHACGRIASATEGQRHNTLNREAYTIGGYVGAGWLRAEEAEEDLIAAGMAAGKKNSEVRRTVSDAIEAGSEHPRNPPPRAARREDPPPPTDADLGIFDLSEARKAAGWDVDTSESDDRIRILVTKRQAIDVIRDAWAALHAANEDPPRLFMRDGRIVRLRQTETGCAIVQCAPVDVHSELIRCARWVKMRRARRNEPTASGWVEQDAEQPPAFVAADMHASPDSLPVLESVVYTPVFDAERRLIAEPGYSPHARLWYERRRDLQPQVYSVEEARELLCSEWLSDFPFSGLHDRAYALALFLLPFVRRMIDGPTPLHLIEAPMVGSGKSLLGRVVCSAAMGRDIPLSPFDRDERERRKAITSALFSGKPIVFFDNVRGRLASESLEAATTSTRWSDRLLGSTAECEVPIKTVWVASANNATLSEDMVRRTVRIRLVHNVENPSALQNWRHPDLARWTDDNHSRLISAAISLIGAWKDLGAPMGAETLGGYESWSRTIGGILSASGIGGFLADRAEWTREASPDSLEWESFVRLWWSTKGDAMCYPSDLRDLAACNNLLCTIWSACNNDRASDTKFGMELRARADRIISGFRIVRRSSANGYGYRLEDIADHRAF